MMVRGADHLTARAKHVIIEITDGAEIQQHDLVLFGGLPKSQQVIPEIGVGLHLVPFEHFTAAAELHDGATDKVTALLGQLQHRRVRNTDPFLEGHAHDVVAGELGDDLRHHKAGIISQNLTEVAGSMGFKVIIHLATKHFPHFVQPHVELFSNRYQAAELEQANQCPHVRINGIRHTRILNLQNQLFAV